MFVFIGAIMLVAWLHLLFTATDLLIWQRDWHCLWAAGDALLTGQTNALYTTVYSPAFEESVCHTGYFWLYPPYALYPVLGLALFSPWTAYWLIFSAIVVGLVAGMKVIQKLYPDSGASTLTFGLAVFASEPFNGVLVTGQNSAWLLLAILSGILALQHQKWFWAAAAFSVLGLKPNWVIFVVLWMVYARNWRVVAQMAGLGALMILSTLPLGFSLWTDFFASSTGYADYVWQGYPVGKLITTHATLRSFGWQGTAAFWPMWVVLQGAILLSTWIVWRSDRSIMAKGGLMVLATVGCNVYTNFYDGLLLIVPAMVWWFEKERYDSRWWGVIGLAIAGVWLWLWMRIVPFPETPYTPVGIFLVVWALAEGFATLSWTPKSTPAPHRA